MFIVVLYLLSYFVFSFLTKTLGKASPGPVLVLASLIACQGVWIAGLAFEALWQRWRRGDDETRRQDDSRQHPSLIHRIAPHLFRRDVVIVATMSAVIIVSSTSAYALPGVSLLVPLLLMKGGPNIWAPLIDWLNGSAVTTRARIVFGLALVAVVGALWSKVSVTASVAVTAAVGWAALYMLAYFPKLKIMARYRGDLVFLIADMTTTLLIALPAVVVLVWLKYGAGGLWQSMQLLTDPRIWAMGAASEGAGLFGGLVFLAKTESTLSVPINRCSSLLGGTAATLALWWLDGGTLLGWAGRNVPELIGVVAMLAALVIGVGRGGGVSVGAGQRVVGGDETIPTVLVTA
jgi:hypothetical protein